MPSSTGVTTLVVGMFISGCANSLLSKYQDKECVENCGPDPTSPRVDFEQPVWQTLNMFIGEFCCGLPLLYKYFTSPVKITAIGAVAPESSLFNRLLSRLHFGTASEPGYTHLPVDDALEPDEDEAVILDLDDRLRGWRVLWLWIPAFFDICGSTLMNVGLILSPVSIYQMSRGALVLWVGVLSVIFLRRRLWLYQWTALVIVTLGVCSVGLSGSLENKSETALEGVILDIVKRRDEDPAKVALGVILVLFAQVFTACQFVVEEKIMSRYKVEPLAAVTLEGFYGMVTTAVSMPFLHIFLRVRSPYFDIPRGWHQIISTPTVLWSCLAIMISLGSFNYFGLSVTSRVSATTRSTIDTCRTLGIWVFAGFGMLVYGTFVFNGLIRPLCFTPPPTGDEAGLERTAEVPAAVARGRVGYDVVPDEDD
ncbi:MAG: hypothetical protein TREMPRED_002958 [Tremellales sp. Tagirdzhanova-0007]|nr:MAG: hypothetical protein TREMPRED_002958 [Tremellales sp. Tagirdzhanova-0007]